MSLCDRYWRQQKYIVYRGWLLSLKRIFELFCIMVVLCVAQCKLLWGNLCGKCNWFCFNNLSKEIIKSLRISRDSWFIECLKFRCVWSVPWPYKRFVISYPFVSTFHFLFLFLNLFSLNILQTFVNINVLDIPK